MGRAKSAITRGELRQQRAAEKPPKDTSMPLRTEPAVRVPDSLLKGPRMRVEELPDSWKQLPVGELFQRELDDTVRTKLGASRAVSVMMAAKIRRYA